MTPSHSTEIAMRPGAVAEFDLTLLRPGLWELTGHLLPWALRYTRMAHAMSYADYKSGSCEFMVVRLHNRWAREWKR